MSSYPKAPGAAAIILSYSETGDAESAEVLVHVRIKVLTEAGRSAGNVEVPARIVSNDEFKQDFYARTIHPNGSVALYAANTTNSYVTTVDQTEITRVAAVPEVTVGSIVEYGYHFAGQNTFFTHLIGYYHPIWQVQQKYFVVAGHFTLKTPEELAQDDIRWSANLPTGAHLDCKKNRFDLNVADVPAGPDEDLLPPLVSILYNVRFFYWDKPRDRYWGETGAREDNLWSEFYKPRKALRDVVHDLLLPSDTDDVKLRKLYAAVQTFENTDLTRARTIREDKQAGLSVAKNSEDVWNRKRGDSEELTLLFIALCRSAGYQAYPMQVSSRNRAIFSQDVLSWSQMDSMIAIVVVDGHEMYFDPGTRRCPIGHLAPWHSGVVGVSTEAKLVKIRSTPEASPADNRTDRVADLTLDTSGQVTGTIEIGWFGTAALQWRRQAVSEDEFFVRSAIEHELQAEIPNGVDVKLDMLTALADSDLPLRAKLTVSGHLGMRTAKRLMLPAQFFVSLDKPILVSDKRFAPVAFPAAYTMRDEMKLHLPSDMSAETLPAGRHLQFGAGSEYIVRNQPPSPQQKLIVTQRIFVLSKIDFAVSDYPALHSYFAQVATSDQDQIILQVAPLASGN